MLIRKKDYFFMALLPVSLFLISLLPGDSLLNCGIVTVFLWIAFYSTEAIVHLYARKAANAEKNDDTELVKRCYRQIYFLSPNSLSGLFAGGVLCAMEGRWVTAEVLFREFLTHRPWDFRAGYNMGVVTFQQGKTAEAKKWLKTILHFQPWHGHAHAVLGDVYHQEGKHEKAEKHYLTAWRLGNRMGQLKMLHPEIRGV